MRLGWLQTELLLMLLLAHPDGGATKNELIWLIWGGEREPDSAGLNLIGVVIHSLRRKGVGILTRSYGRGYHIPREARG